MAQMADFMWYCKRCGNVGFHSEACIAASSAERIAASAPDPMTPPTEPTGLRWELEAWATRNEPWTGPASMTAEDGYNAAIEEVVGMLNYLRAALASPEPSGDVDAAWHGLYEALGRRHGDAYDDVILADHRPLIEAAIRGDLITKAEAETYVASLVERNADRLGLDVERLARAIREGTMGTRVHVGIDEARPLAADIAREYAALSEASDDHS